MKEMHSLHFNFYNWYIWKDKLWMSDLLGQPSTLLLGAKLKSCSRNHAVYRGTYMCRAGIYVVHLHYKIPLQVWTILSLSQRVEIQPLSGYFSLGVQTTQNIILTLVQLMAWRRPGNKPLFEPMMVSLLMHKYASLPLNEKREREIKFIGLLRGRGHQGPYKSCNHNLYIGIIIFPHIDNPQSTGYN